MNIKKVGKEDRENTNYSKMQKCKKISKCKKYKSKFKYNVND